jgi:diguanylate cyclase
MQDWMGSFSVLAGFSFVAVVGYVLGRQQLRRPGRAAGEGRHEIARALSVARELESIAARMRRTLAWHQPALVKFKRRLKDMEEGQHASWQDLCDRADELLKPTLRLSSDISHAYAEVLRQMAHLSSFAEMRSDALTGINNRRAFDESLQAALTAQERYPAPLTLALIDVDGFKRVNDERGHLYGDVMLQELGKVLGSTVRECDFAARYGGEEFAVLLPRTGLYDACNFAERLRTAVSTKMPLTASIGLSAWVHGDVASTLVARADAALYEAKNAGGNNTHLHEGASGRIVALGERPARKIESSADQVDAPGVLFSPAEPAIALELQGDARC